MSKNDIPLFDGHCDTLLRLALDRLPTGSLAENNLHADLKRGLSYGKYAQFFAIFAEPDLFPGEDMFDKLCNRFFAEMDYLRGSGFPAALCTCKSEADKAAGDGKAAVFLSVEGAEVLGCELKRLEEARAKGVRSLCLSWNRATELTGTCVQDTDRGLSQKGRDFIRLAGELGVIIDVSHISDRGFWDAAKVSKAPFIASHSNSRSVFAHPRNLTDDMFKAIRDSGGTAGLNLYADFLGPGRAGLEQIVRHVEHFLEMDGEKSVALGGDLDGCDRLPDGIGGIEDMGLIYETFLGRGYPHQLLDDIFYNNLMRVVEQVCTI